MTLFLNLKGICVPLRENQKENIENNLWNFWMRWKISKVEIEK